MYVKADRAMLKRAARDHMRLAEQRPWKVTLVFILLTTGIATLVSTALRNPGSDLLSATLAAMEAGYDYEDIIDVMGMAQQYGGTRGVLSFFLQILLQLYAAVMSFGYMAYNLRRTREEETGTHDLLCGFGMVGKVIGMELIIFVFTLGWTLMVMVPLLLFLTFGSIPISVFIGLALPNEIGLVLFVCVIYLVLIVGIGVICFLALRYSMASFLLLDHPECSGLDAVRRSRELLRGREGELFKLVLSFLGWNIVQGLIIITVSMFSTALFFVLGLNPIISQWLGAALNVLAVLPLGLWLYPYYWGTLAEYYCFLVSQVRPRPEVKAGPPDDYRGPEPF